MTEEIDGGEVGILGSGAAPMLDGLHPSADTWLVPDVEPLESVSSTRAVVGVIDTGVLTDHPSLIGRVIDEIDLTGEGVQDEHGHGTAVAAILAATSPWVDIVSIKALDRTGYADVPRLALAFREAARLLEGRGTLINVSAGRRLPSCRGTCPLCATVRELQDRGFIYACAAGNLPDVTYCPAKVGISVSTPEVWDAPGDVMFPVSGWRRLP